MRIGLFLSLEHALDDDISARFKELLEFVSFARDAGFDFVHAGQHLLVPQFQYLQSLPVLSRIAAESGDMEIGTDILLLALHHPVHVAELAATLDIICGGRFSLGVGLGYRDVEFESLGVRKGSRLKRFLESIELIKRLWTDQSVSFQGEYYQVEDVTLAARPLQQPRPPIVLAASADNMVRRAARVADALSLTGHGTVDTLVRQVEIYKDALQKQGKSFPPEKFRLSKELYVAPTREQAQRESFPYIEAKYDAYSAWGQDDVLPDGESFKKSIHELSQDRFIIGTPDDCIEQITAHHDAIGFQDFSFRLHYPGMPHQQLMGALDLFAQRVLPELKKAS